MILAQYRASLLLPLALASAVSRRARVKSAPEKSASYAMTANRLASRRMACRMSARYITDASSCAPLKSASVAMASESVTEKSCAFASFVPTSRHLERFARLKSIPLRSSPERSRPVKSAGWSGVASFKAASTSSRVRRSCAVAPAGVAAAASRPANAAFRARRVPPVLTGSS